MKNHVIRGLLLSSILSSAPAFAQSAAPADSQSPTPAADAQAAADQGEVVITGIRQSLKAARDIKRDATQFVDSVVSDDIGKLPDRNVAESLARVSGVQVDRGIGEGTSVSVRGLRQNVFLFNGRQIVDASGELCVSDACAGGDFSDGQEIGVALRVVVQSLDQSHRRRHFKRRLHPARD